MTARLSNRPLAIRRLIDTPQPLHRRGDLPPKRPAERESLALANRQSLKGARENMLGEDIRPTLAQSATGEKLASDGKVSKPSCRGKRSGGWFRSLYSNEQRQADQQYTHVPIS